MKKALSLVLALVMVLSMAVVGFAADITKYVDIDLGDITYTTGGNTEVKGSIDVLDANVTEILLTAWNEKNEFAAATDATWNSVTDAVYVALAGKAETVYVKVDVKGASGILATETYVVTTAAEAETVNPLVKAAVEAAAAKHTTEVFIDMTNWEKKVLTASDFAYITNTYEILWKADAAAASYLGFEVTVMNGTTLFDLGLVDYTWTKAIDFSVTDGGIDKDDYAVIRKLTGNTKNPYVFGFSGDACPTNVEIDMVIPQAWINYYGHKNLTLFAWTEAIVAEYQNGANAGKTFVVEADKILAETTLDVNTTVTQRIQFVTETGVLYKTLVLSADATPVADGAAVEDNKDANPNTGANDIVNVAVVFAVVSLAAAGALVCKKSK